MVSRKIKEALPAGTVINKQKTDWSAVFFIVVFLSVHVFWFVFYWAKVNINSFLMAFKNNFDEWDTYNLVYMFNSLFLGVAGGLDVAMKNTALYAIRDSLFIFFHLVIAYFFYKKIRGFKAFQILLYLPGIMSEIAMWMAFKMFIHTEGPIGQLMLAMGLQGTNGEALMLLGEEYAFGTIMFYTLWFGWGGNMLLLGGALARIPVEILESARLDGVGSGRECFGIVLPLVWPTMSTLFILKLTTIFTAGGPILVAADRNNQRAIMNLAYWIFNEVGGVGGANAAGQYKVSAAGFILTCIGVPLVMGLKWLVERVPVVEY